jgi:hypothetical protein
VGALGISGLVVTWLWGVVRRVLQQSEAGSLLRADEVLTALVAAAALIVTVWLACAVVVELLVLVPGRVGRAARAVSALVTPVLVRRALGLLLGVGVAGGLGQGVATAARPDVVASPTTPSPRPAARPLPDPGWLVAPPVASPQHTSAPEDGAGPDPAWAPAGVPGWVPEAPTVRPQPDVRVLSPRPRRTDAGTPTEVVVRRGDSLWSIAARQLGPDPSEAEIAEAWPAWYAANRVVIGPDPDLLLPGQVLRAPEVVRP